jgi:hypothetical protein
MLAAVVEIVRALGGHVRAADLRAISYMDAAYYGALRDAGLMEGRLGDLDAAEGRLSPVGLARRPTFNLAGQG